MSKQVEKVAAATTSLIDTISPMALDFTPKSMIYGDQYARVLVITAYAPGGHAAWMAKVANMPGVVCSIHMSPADPHALLESIKKSMGENKAILQNGADAITTEEALQKYNSGKTLLKKISNEQQAVFNFTALLFIYANDLDTLDRKTRQVEAALAGAGMRGRIAMLKQEEGLISSGPWCKLSDDIFYIGARPIHSETVAASFPFIDSSINDGKGFILGRDNDGGIILIDMWKRGGDRTNANWTILGKPGTGKSTAIKKILTNEFAQGTKIIIIDPEREYKELCNNLGGSWIDCGGGIKGRINPLQVRSVPLDDEDEEDKLYPDELVKKGPLALHMHFLRTFFKLYLKGITEVQLAAMEQLLADLYINDFNIPWDVDPKTIPNDKWPIISDLYNKVKEQAKVEPEYFKDISKLLWRIAEGADSAIWNGHTTINLDSDFIVLDTHELINADETLQRAQYYNILSFAWNNISIDRQMQILLGCDEGYLLIDEDNPDTVKYIRNISKRIRKYMGGLMFITHNTVDLNSANLRQYGQALLDNPCFKLIFGLGENDLAALTKIMKLSEAEFDMLSKSKRGNALLVAGSKRVHAIVELASFEKELFGKGGGN